MANAIIDIGLSGKTHQEQTEDLQKWVNTYAWAATDETTGNDDKKHKESELDGGLVTGTGISKGVGPSGNSARNVRRNGGANLNFNTTKERQGVTAKLGTTQVSC